MKLHNFKEPLETLDTMLKEVNSELHSVKEKGKEELNLWLGLASKFTSVKACSDHLAETLELIDNQSLEAQQSKSLLEGSMCEQLKFLTNATLRINDFSGDLIYSEHERALCALRHGQLKCELKDLEKALATAVKEAKDMAKHKEMIEVQLEAARETSVRDKEMLLQIQRSILLDTEEVDQRFQEGELSPKCSLDTLGKLISQVTQLQAIKRSLQIQVEEHTSYAAYLEQCFACRREVTEDKLDALQMVLQAARRQTEEFSIENQNLHKAVKTLKEENSESTTLVWSLRRKVTEMEENSNKQIDEIHALQAALQAARRQAEVSSSENQNLTEAMRILTEENNESATLVVSLRSKVTETEEVSKKQLGEMDALHSALQAAWRQSEESSVENEKLNNINKILEENKYENTTLVASLRRKVTELEENLKKQFNEMDALQAAIQSARRQAEESFVEKQKLDNDRKILKEQNYESTTLVASLRRKVTETEENSKKQLGEIDALQSAVKAAQRQAEESFVLNQKLNNEIMILKNQIDEEVLKLQSTTLIASLRREGTVTEENSKKQLDEIENEISVSLGNHVYQIIKDIAELKSLYDGSNVTEETPEDLKVVQQGLDEKCLEKDQLKNLIHLLRGRQFLDLKQLGWHLKIAKVEIISAYTRQIEDSKKEKEDMKDEITDLQKRNEQLSNELVAAEKINMDLKIKSEQDLCAKEEALTKHLQEISQRNEQNIKDSNKEKENLKDDIAKLQKRIEQLSSELVAAQKCILDLKIKSEHDLRAKEEALTRHLREISQCNEQKIVEMRRNYEFKLMENVSKPEEAVKSHQNTETNKGKENVKNNNATQGVANVATNQQTVKILLSEDSGRGNASKGPQPSTKEKLRKATDEPQVKRLKSGPIMKGSDAPTTKTKVTRRLRAEAAGTTVERQMLKRRSNVKVVVDQQELHPEELLNESSGGAEKRAREVETNRSPSSGLGELFGSLLDPDEVESDPYAFF